MLRITSDNTYCSMCRKRVTANLVQVPETFKETTALRCVASKTNFLIRRGVYGNLLPRYLELEARCGIVLERHSGCTFTSLLLQSAYMCKYENLRYRFRSLNGTINEINSINLACVEDAELSRFWIVFLFFSECSDKLFILCLERAYTYKINLLNISTTQRKKFDRLVYFATHFNMKNNLETLAVLGKGTSLGEQKDIFQSRAKALSASYFISRVTRQALESVQWN